MTALIVYNTLSRNEEEFVPLHGKEVKMFVCGQTVYDDAHLGHAKNYINFDIIARWLRHSGYKVKYIQNITDIDDKIIKRAQEQSKDPIALAREFEERFMEDMDAIGVKKGVDSYPRSHDYIKEMANQIQTLIDNSYAYPLEEDIYFDVSKFKNYTKLSGMKLEELEKHRIEPKEGKKNNYDFALWKGSKEGEPSWEISLTIKGEKRKLKGRPGWHIEDTATTEAIFGKQYDLHGGAIELIFPHHTNEIAQAEAAFNVKPFVKYWLHAGIMLIKGEKMSKSLKNFIRIRDLLKNYDPEELRLLIASTHYRKDVGYTEELMKKASLRLRYMYASLSIVYNSIEVKGKEAEQTKSIVEALKTDFKEAMDQDFNTPLALTSLSTTIDRLRTLCEKSNGIDPKAKEMALKAIHDYGAILGILQKDSYKQKLEDDASALIKSREEMRAAKKFENADKIRSELKEKYNIILEDSEYGTIWYHSK